MLYLARKLTDNQETLKTIYYSLVQPYFDYCDVVWGDCCKTRADKLQKLQKQNATDYYSGWLLYQIIRCTKHFRVVKLRRKKEKTLISYDVSNIK